MKTIISALFLSGVMMLAQTFPPLQPPILIHTGTNADDHSGEHLGRNTWLEINASLMNLYANQTNLAAQLAVATNGYPKNIVRTSFLVSELYSNPFVFHGSNFIGAFTNIYSFSTYGLNQGTNQNLTNNMSLDGGATWQSFFVTNPIAPTNGTLIYSNPFVITYLVSTNVGTNTWNIAVFQTNWNWSTNVFTNFYSVPVSLSVLSGLYSTGAVSVITISDPSLYGKYNSFAVQTFDFTAATVVGTLNGRFPFIAPGGVTNYLCFTNGFWMGTN